MRRRERTARERASVAAIFQRDPSIAERRAWAYEHTDGLAESVRTVEHGPEPMPASLAESLVALVRVREEQHYLRTDYVRALGHEGLMALVRTLTFARDRDRRDDVMLDYLALELARRQAPLCAVCATGATGECDERCDRIAGAR